MKCVDIHQMVRDWAYRTYNSTVGSRTPESDYYFMMSCDQQTRVIQEYCEVKERKERLHQFLIKEYLDTLCIVERHLLESQGNAMADYMEILADRIEYFLFGDQTFKMRRVQGDYS